LLGWWREGLSAMYSSGEVRHPVYVALRGAVDRHSIPQEPFADLIRAFVQDQTVARYETYEDLFEYCRYSANPVGRLVLRLCGYADDTRVRLSDATCTALQLANFWQDVTVDFRKDRVYIPLEALRRHGSSIEEIAARRATPGFRAAMREVVDRAQALFEEGLPLTQMMDRRLSLDLDLFSRGGMRVLAKIRERGYDVLSARPAISKDDVLSARPAISKGERVRLLAGALARVAFRKAA
jgi:squalene synthase HpnC